MFRRVSAAGTVLALGTLVAGCAEASRQGTALLRNATDQAPLKIVVRDQCASWTSWC